MVRIWANKFFFFGDPLNDFFFGRPEFFFPGDLPNNFFFNSDHAPQMIYGRPLRFFQFLILCTPVYISRVSNSISPIPLIYMFICTMQRSFALPEYVSNLFTNLTDIRVKQKSSDMCIYTWRIMAWDLGCY